jgi:hypothetical protein
MGRFFASWATSIVLLALASTADAQQVRADVGVTTERQGVSLNVDARYTATKYKLFALGRVFINEPESQALKQPPRYDNPIALEVVVGRFFRSGSSMFSPIVGFDTNKRIIAGADARTTLIRRTISYIGYGNFATDDRHTNAMRHRVMFDLLRDEKLFLRFDWRKEGSKQEHCRLGVEYNTRIDKLNLPVYLEPFWNFTPGQIGVRVGARL